MRTSITPPSFRSTSAGRLAREQPQRRSTIRGFTTPWPCTIRCRAGPLLKQEGKLFMTPSLPEILGLATRVAQLNSPSTCDASPKSRVPGPLISSSLGIARPHSATSNATIDLPKRALADLSAWTASGYWCLLERSHSRESGNPRGDNGATDLCRSVLPRIARL
jgi:hypothetical protein